MPRLKLCCKKNWKRKKYEETPLVVSIKLSLLPRPDSTCSPPPALSVSLPLTLYTSLPLSTLYMLHSRLKMMPQLLNGWVDTSRGDEEVTICNLQQSTTSPCPSVQFTIVIKQDLTWQVYYHLTRIEPDNAALQNIPTVITCMENISRLTSTISASKCCIGNPDEKFTPVLSCHELGEFKDRSGECL